MSKSEVDRRELSISIIRDLDQIAQIAQKISDSKVISKYYRKESKEVVFETDSVSYNVDESLTKGADEFSDLELKIIDQRLYDVKYGVLIETLINNRDKEGVKNRKLSNFFEIIDDKDEICDMFATTFPIREDVFEGVLEFAVVNSEPSTLGILIENGADVHRVNSGGDSLLHTLAHNFDHDKERKTVIARILLESGVSTELKDSQGCAAFECIKLESGPNLILYSVLGGPKEKITEAGASQKPLPHKRVDEVRKLLRPSTSQVKVSDSVQPSSGNFAKTSGGAQKS